MSKISIKYKQGTGSGDIEALELKYRLKQESKIPALRIYGYANGSDIITQLKTESVVEYAEIQQTMGIAGRKDSR